MYKDRGKTSRFQLVYINSLDSKESIAVVLQMINEQHIHAFDDGA